METGIKLLISAEFWLIAGVILLLIFLITPEKEQAVETYFDPTKVKPLPNGLDSSNITPSAEQAEGVDEEPNPNILVLPEEQSLIDKRTRFEDLNKAQESIDNQQNSIDNAMERVDIHNDKANLKLQQAKLTNKNNSY